MLRERERERERDSITVIGGANNALTLLPAQTSYLYNYDKFVSDDVSRSAADTFRMQVRY